MHKVKTKRKACFSVLFILVILESTTTTAKAAIDLIDNIEKLDANDRFTKLKNLVKLLEDSAQRNSEKATLAKVTSDAVKKKGVRKNDRLI